MKTTDSRKAEGLAARSSAPRSSHADWGAVARRPDPVGLLEAQNESRVPWLVPLRHARMRVSPFTFFRGTATIMAADLAATPVSGIDVQLGGDAHLSNFGAYASVARTLVFDANDFDETLRGPWEWDLKRLATSIMIAGQSLGFSSADCRTATAHSVASYRRAMREFATMGFLDQWYDHVTVADVQEAEGMDAAQFQKRLERFQRRAKKRTSLQALDKLTIEVDGRRRIRSDPPVLLPLRDLPSEYEPERLEVSARQTLDAYRTTLADDRHWLLDRYEVVDIGVKVVGVGSVGTRCLIAYLEGRDENDPLFLQAKEVGRSVLEAHLEPSPYANNGQRVVEGQRLVQAQSDMFLGWTEGRLGRQFYVRQLRDWKGSVDVDTATPVQLRFYAGMCGQTMARGHARSGDAVAIGAYLGKGDRMDRAITAFAEAYAEQNSEDYAAFVAAIEIGRLPVGELL